MRYKHFGPCGEQTGRAAVAGLARTEARRASMLSHIAEWAVAVLAGGVIAGLVVATYARHRAAGAVAGGRVRLPPRVVHDLRRRINGPPDVW